MAVQVKHLFLLDPRREAHDARTWRLLEPGAPFHVELDKLVGGAARDSLDEVAYLQEVATISFTPVVETTMEEKHGKVSLALKGHSIGPVRVSLSNRWPWLLRQRRRKHLDATALLDAFEKTTQLKQVPVLLGLDSHPRLVDANLKPSASKPILAELLYNCDVPGLYKSQRKAAKADE